MNNNKTTKLPIVIILILLLAVAFLFWFANNKFSNNALSQVFPEKLGLDTSDTSRGGENSEDPFDIGTKALVDKDYKKASEFFDRIPVDDETYTKARLYLAYSQYESEHYKEAVKNATIVIEKASSTLLKQKAEWIQLQAMLADGDTDDATFDKLLDKIAANEKHIVQNEAVELKESMNSFWRGLVF